MNIGKWAIALFLICLLSFSMLAIFTIIKQDQSTDAIYISDSMSTINRSVNLTENAISYSSSMISPLMLLVAILFLLAAFFIFRRKW